MRSRPPTQRRRRPGGRAALLVFAIAALLPAPAQGQTPNDAYSIYTVRADGTGMRELTGTASVGRLVEWSPDGQSIAFLRRAGVFAVAPDGTEVRKLVDSPLNPVTGFSWSPDSRRLAYSQVLPGEFIYVRDLASGSRTQLTGNTSADPYGAGDITQSNAPAWSPDGTRIVFYANAAVRGAAPGSGATGIWVMNADGSDQRPVRGARSVAGVTNNLNPSFTPDGRIRYLSQTGSRFEWRTVAPDGSGPAALLVGPLTDDAAWSPDGSRIAYSLSQPGAGLGSIAAPLFVSPLGGPLDGPPTRLADNGVNPTWSPDGTQIAFIARSGPRTAVLTARRLSGQVRYRRPGQRGFRRLAGSRPLPYGTSFDTRRGRLRLTVRHAGDLHSRGDFSGGQFRTKPDRDASAGPVLNIHLTGRLACRSGRGPGRQLAGSTNGVIGIFARRSQLYLGGRRRSRWLMADRCDGSTLTALRRGDGNVYDFPGRQPIPLSPGDRHVAPPPRS